jgi:hypothetical protein
MINHQDRERTKIRARRAQRVTYDLPPNLRHRIKDLAEEQRLPASQLVTLALLRFLDDYEQEDSGPQSARRQLDCCKQPSRSPRYDWNLAYPPELLALAQPKSSKG